MSKDLWFAEMERILAEKEDAGIPFDRAYEEAGNEAHGALTERLADMADHARLIKKERKLLSINDTRTVDARRLLGDIAANMAGYSDHELLRLKNSADTFSWMVRMELKDRDARMVDEACALKTGDEA